MKMSIVEILQEIQPMTYLIDNSEIRKFIVEHPAKLDGKPIRLGDRHHVTPGSKLEIGNLTWTYIGWKSNVDNSRKPKV